MINKKKICFLLLLLLIINFKSFSQESAYIVYNINNDIITNIDIKKESRYLTALNNQLNNLSEEKILEISKESALREKVKKIEILKYFNLDKISPEINNYLKNFYIRLNLNNEIEFQEYLNSNNLTLDYVRKKIQIEMIWNQLIYEKYKDQVNIDIEKLKNEIKNNQNKKDQKIYQLSEIVFQKSQQDNLNKIRDINESIKDIGFKNSANIYSISDSSKFGGAVGWIEEEKLSKKISSELKKLEVGQHTLPINTGNSFIILRIDEIKYEIRSIDEKQELERKISFERNRQLKKFSKIHYGKIKINSNINEL